MPKAASSPIKRTATKYGITVQRPMTDIEWELQGIRCKYPEGLGKFQHVKNSMDILLPGIVNAKNDWNLDQIESLCRTDYARIQGNTIHRFISWTGPAAAGKTFTAANFAFVWWLADAANSIVVLTSTTSKMVRRRVWPEITKAYHSARKQVGILSGIPAEKVVLGNMVDSKTTLQNAKGDDKHGIFAIAVEDGDVNAAMAEIQGMHAPRILVIVDEATDTSDAIVRVCENLKKACQDFTLLLIGNASPGLNPHTEFSEPVNGWESVSVEDEEWRTKVGGVCLHFDGFKSPNVKLGKTLFPFIYTYEDYLLDLEKDQDTIDFWKYTRGYWAPEGVRDTVFTLQMVERCDVKGLHRFLTWSHPIASLDPAFGGDKCVWRKGMMGDIPGGKIGIQLELTVYIEAKATERAEVDKQIAEQVVALNLQHGVKPKHFGMDATGTGRGVFSHIYSDWSWEIFRCEFGGAPSDLPASVTDSRPSKEVYDRQVTELWFSVSEFVLGFQLKGCTRNEIAQFCARKFKDEGRKKKLETKKDFKTHYRQDGKNCSPDEADAVAVMIALARSLGAIANASGPVLGNASKSWLALAKESTYVEEGSIFAHHEESALFEAI